MGEQLIVAHVGDSRAYAIYTDGSLRVLTRDHSLVKRLEELGQITADEASVHPQRNVLYRALGQGEPFEPDISTYPLPQGGYLMLCSDGLWGQVEEQVLISIIKEAKTPEIACQQMVAAANGAGGPDNISVLLVRIPH
jgi:serine/threonine protein phosphatase PrpC